MEAAAKLEKIKIFNATTEKIEAVALKLNIPQRAAKTKKATFAAGCFWGVEAAFRQLIGKGVVSTKVGYTGSSFKNPTYEDVCSNKTGHAEAVEIIYDPDKISYEKLLDIFWSTHDPTTPNRQGPDVGSQYRSVIFFHTPEQERLAKASKDKLQKSKKFRNKIVTEIIKAGEFFPAEEYHQRYNEKQGIKPTCHIPYSINRRPKKGVDYGKVNRVRGEQGPLKERFK